MTKDIWDRLTEVFDKILREGPTSLTSDERELFLIQDFILEFENGGLSGYFYNRLPGVADIQAAIDAMHRHGFTKLANALQEALDLFRDYRDPDPPTIWKKTCQKYDAGGRLETIQRRIMALKGYGLAAAENI